MALRPPAPFTGDSAAASINIGPDLSIPRNELAIQTSRSSGAGGQHVNKTSSRVEMTWSIAESKALTEDQRALLLKKLASRLSADGTLRVVASATRSQLRNRQAAEERLCEVVRQALIVPKRRKPTRRPRAANETRLTEKKQHSDKKRERKRPTAE